MITMHRRLFVLAMLPMALFAALLPHRVDAAAKTSAGCTTIIVGKKATADESVILAHKGIYAYEAHGFGFSWGIELWCVRNATLQDR